MAFHFLECYQGSLSRATLRARSVTYAGHPLDLIERGGAGTGEGYFEPGPQLPPWHGLCWLRSAGGAPVPWAGTTTTTTIGGKTVLAERPRATARPVGR
jgi:hypothetical protein